MMTYTTVSWILIGLAGYGACIAGCFMYLTRDNALQQATTIDDDLERCAELQRVVDRMEEGRY